jgi:hypothetical protein
MATQTRRCPSDNVLAVLPGTDPALADEPILLIAHLDGYGYGTPVKGDGLYSPRVLGAGGAAPRPRRHRRRDRGGSPGEREWYAT